ncbi:hypothetical protein L1987_08589 [Smallanthus sonchifolius]|uniref:Uncharacterized protein n=1 Tax=Smallanthus sonchifolius TaxID=185202 RepID=A0ACB9JKK6_9ASTR|nr:hypothetical protein L1987_08589 [Smallanthus sonchifolius]
MWYTLAKAPFEDIPVDSATFENLKIVLSKSSVSLKSSFSSKGFQVTVATKEFDFPSSSEFQDPHNQRNLSMSLKDLWKSMDINKDKAETHIDEQILGESTDELSKVIVVYQGSTSDKGKALMTEPEVETVTLTDSISDIEKDHEMLKLLDDIDDIANLSTLVIPEFESADKIVFKDADGHLFEGFSDNLEKNDNEFVVHPPLKQLLSLNNKQLKRV